MRLSTLLCLAMLAAVWEATPARADDVAPPATQYEDAIQRGLHEFSLEHWNEAKVLFAHAHSIRPNARTLRGLGLACYELRQYVEAIGYFEAALAHPVQPLTPEMNRDVQTFLARSREFVGRFKLDVQPTTAEVAIDGESALRPGPDGSYMVDPGSHEIAVTAPGFEQQVRTLFAEGGKTTRVVVALKPLVANYPEPPAPTPAKVTSVAAAEKSSPSYLGPWLTIGISATVAVAGGVMLGIAAANKSEVENADSGDNWSDYSSAYDTGNALFPIGGVMLGVGLAGVAVGIGWRVMASPDAPESSVALDVTPTGVRISGHL